MDDTPPGGRMILTGLLRYKFGRGMIIVLDDGNWWKASGLPWKARHFINQRVTADAVRVGFWSIDVVKIEGAPDDALRR